MTDNRFDDELTPVRKTAGFYGGLRLPTDKHELAAEPIREAPLPDQIVLPLSQHAGLPSMPVVEVGDRVLRGQLLAAPEGLISAALHASTSGTVTAIGQRPVPHPSGLTGECIVIEPDGDDRWTEANPVDGDYHDRDPLRVRQHVRSAGIVGLGGAVFPTSTKLTARADIHLHTLILNGAECDPQISCDEALMRTAAQDIIEGARVALHVLQVNRCMIGIEDDKPDSEQALREAVEACDDDRFIVTRVPAIYPEGSENQLIQALSGEQVPSEGLPLDIGFVCINVATAAAIKAAVIDGRPLTSRLVTVTGAGVRERANVLTRFGSPLASLVELCGGYTDDASRLVIGGAMMGFAVPNDAVPIVKASNSIMVMTPDEARGDDQIRPCIRCGECARVCPARLLPQQLYWHAGADSEDGLRRHNLFDCIECGCCDYVCPSHIRLAEHFRFAKARIAFRDIERERADVARERFLARSVRLSQQSNARAVKTAQRKQRAAAAADAAARREVIGEVMQRVEQRDKDKPGDAENEA